MGFIVSNQNKSDRKAVHFSLVSSKNLLLIFTRNPELGKCKTRLAATIGDESALEIYKFLLAHTVKITSNLNLAKQVYYSVRVRENDIWDSLLYAKKKQTGSDLGERMANAFQAGFADGFEKICIIGSDLFDLSQEDIEQAFAKLDTNDVVIGPALDGGYYLLGLKVMNANIFKDKNWGTATVMKDTLEDLKNLKIHLLEARNDVDVYEDIKNDAAFKPFLKHL